MKRSKDHVFVGLGFVLASIIIAAGIYFGLRVIGSSDVQKGMNTVEEANYSSESVELTENAVSTNLDTYDATETFGTPLTDEELTAALVGSSFAESQSQGMGWCGTGAISFGVTGTDGIQNVDIHTKVSDDGDRIISGPVEGNWKVIQGDLILFNLHAVDDGGNEILSEIPSTMRMKLTVDLGDENYMSEIGRIKLDNGPSMVYCRLSEQ